MNSSKAELLKSMEGIDDSIRLKSDEETFQVMSKKLGELSKYADEISKVYFSSRQLMCLTNFFELLDQFSFFDAYNELYDFIHNYGEKVNETISIGEFDIFKYQIDRLQYRLKEKKYYSENSGISIAEMDRKVDLENTRKSMGNSFGTGYEAVIDRIGLIEGKIDCNDSNETREIIVNNAKEALVILEKCQTNSDSQVANQNICFYREQIGCLNYVLYFIDTQQINKAYLKLKEFLGYFQRKIVESDPNWLTRKSSLHATERDLLWYLFERIITKVSECKNLESFKNKLAKARMENIRINIDNANKYLQAEQPVSGEWCDEKVYQLFRQKTKQNLLSAVINKDITFETAIKNEEYDYIVDFIINKDENGVKTIFSTPEFSDESEILYSAPEELSATLSQFLEQKQFKFNDDIIKKYPKETNLSLLYRCISIKDLGKMLNEIICVDNYESMKAEKNIDFDLIANRIRLAYDFICNLYPSLNPAIRDNTSSGNPYSDEPDTEAPVQVDTELANYYNDLSSGNYEVAYEKIKEFVTSYLDGANKYAAKYFMSMAKSYINAYKK